MPTQPAALCLIRISFRLFSATFPFVSIASATNPGMLLCSVNTCHRMAQIFLLGPQQEGKVMPAPKIADRVTDDTEGVNFRSPAPERREPLITDVTIEHGPVDL